MGAGDSVAADDPVPLLDQVLDSDMKVGISAAEPCVNTSLSLSAPVALSGNGVRTTASGSTSSSIVLEISCASPVFVASWNRLTVALLPVIWAVDIVVALWVDGDHLGVADGRFDAR
jgi:hypothetical protein